jgi:hypothetical protein
MKSQNEEDETMSKQQKPLANPDPVVAAEQAIAALERDRAELVDACAQDGAEMQKNAYAARVLHELSATRALAEIGERGREHDQRLREIDAALVTARSVLQEAQAAEVAAVNRQRAEELRKHVDELSRVPAYIEKHLTDALRGLIAFERGVAELHQLGIPFPTDVQLRLGIVAVLGTWLQQLPKLWWNEIAAGLRFRAPAERKSAISYWAQLEPSLRNAIRQRLGEAEQTNTEAA